MIVLEREKKFELYMKKSLIHGIEAFRDQLYNVAQYFNEDDPMLETVEELTKLTHKLRRQVERRERKIINEVTVPPFRPKDGEKFYYMDFDFVIMEATYAEDEIGSLMCVAARNCFRTYQEAESNIEETVRKIKKARGEE